MLCVTFMWDTLYFIKDLQFTLALCGLAVSISLVDVARFHGNALAMNLPARSHGNDEIRPMRLKLKVCKTQV